MSDIRPDYGVTEHQLSGVISTIEWAIDWLNHVPVITIDADGPRPARSSDVIAGLEFIVDLLATGLPRRRP